MEAHTLWTLGQKDRAYPCSPICYLLCTKSAKVNSVGSARVNQQHCQHCGTQPPSSWAMGMGCWLTYSEEDRSDSGENWGERVCFNNTHVHDFWQICEVGY
jgi:hypothetical protein